MNGEFFSGMKDIFIQAFPNYFIDDEDDEKLVGVRCAYENVNIGLFHQA